MEQNANRDFEPGEDSGILLRLPSISERGRARHLAKQPASRQVIDIENDDFDSPRISGYVHQASSVFLRRAFDVFVALTLLALLWPVMLLTAIAIKLDSSGPVFFKQERVGLRGRRFMCIKFRSMNQNAESDGVARWAQTNDPRVTRVGQLIRKCRIDELPQLFNVLRGEMRMVGPRPERPYFVEQLRNQISGFEYRHSVLPGITGWAQIKHGYCASVADAEKKLALDLYYVENASLLFDLRILVETVRVVLFGVGAR